MRSKRQFMALSFASLCTLPAMTMAQSYPSRPVRMVVAFAAGGPTDVLARIVAAGMTKTLGQQVIVENRAGGGGMIGTKEVAKAQPDGYTILFAGDASLTVQPQLSSNAGYDARKDFTPLRLVASQANVLVVNASKGISDINTLVSRARAKTGSLSFGSAGNGSPSHLVGALFETQVGIDLVHVPYKGAAPAMTDLIGGQIDMLFVGTPVALQNATRKDVLMLAVTGDKRLPSLPHVSTFAEAGIRNLGGETAVWWSMMAPAGLPLAIGLKLDNALRTTLSDPEIQKNLATQGVDVLNLDAKAADQWIARDHAKWGALIRAKKVSTE